VIENTLGRLALRRQAEGRDLTAGERLSVAVDAAKEMARPAAFGQAIILLVYAPLLTFEGVEGKMFTPMAATVMFALAGAFVFALEIPDWRNQPLETHRVRMTIDGEVVGEGDAEDVGGHPIMPLIWLANDRSRRGDGLKAGQFVTTGSVTGVKMAPAVSEIVADFGSFGQVRLNFTD